MRYERALDELAASLGVPAQAESAAAVPPAAPVEDDVAEPADPEPSSTPTPSELKALETFTAEYQPLWEEGVDPLALPSSHDRRGMLRAAADPTAEGPSVDVVVCVHDALEDVRRCLWSLSHKASYPFRLILVNDGSDEQTSAFLRSTVIASPTITLIENQTPPHGYTIAANLGMREAGADYVVLLNSDTIVTHGWLERILACGESDERIGILGPLSNAASHQSIPELREGDSWATNPLPDFVTEDGVASYSSAFRRGPGRDFRSSTGSVTSSSAMSSSGSVTSTRRASPAATARRTTSAFVRRAPGLSSRSPMMPTSSTPSRSRSRPRP